MHHFKSRQLQHLRDNQCCLTQHHISVFSHEVDYHFSMEIMASRKSLATKRPQNKSHFRMSLNAAIKQSQIAGKGHNETLEIVNPVKHTKSATDDRGGHVPGNGGTCHAQFTFGQFWLTEWENTVVAKIFRELTVVQTVK
jgi:hypothetical protein